MRSSLGTRHWNCWNWQHNSKPLPICSQRFWSCNKPSHSALRVQTRRHKPKHFHSKHRCWHWQKLRRRLRLFFGWIRLRLDFLFMGAEQIMEICSQFLLPWSTARWFQYRRLELSMGRRRYLRNELVTTSERWIQNSLLQSTCFSSWI